ncbi:MAG TPA: YggT family protein, partial [Sphaerochaeta sp.]|nr:YggT family protein [Sphaerochaeta sp.]
MNQTYYDSGVPIIAASSNVFMTIASIAAS